MVPRMPPPMYMWISFEGAEATVKHLENQRSGRCRTHRLKDPRDSAASESAARRARCVPDRAERQAPILFCRRCSGLPKRSWFCKSLVFIRIALREICTIALSGVPDSPEKHRCPPIRHGRWVDRPDRWPRRHRGPLAGAWGAGAWALVPEPVSWRRRCCPTCLCSPGCHAPNVGYAAGPI